MKIRCAIIDDEYLAREYIKDYVSKIPSLELVGDFNSPLKALELIKSGNIDLLFLDIQMPDITGLDFLKSLNKQPLVIFTTAHKEFALDSYEFSVIDYMLKPFSFDRFLKAAVKAIDHLKQTTSIKNHGTGQGTETELHDDYLVVRADRRFYKINYRDLIYIEGQKAYVTFNTVRNRVTALASLKELEDSLPENQFVRIHKSYIVSINKILSLEGNMIDIGNKQLPVGKNYRNKVDEIFGLK